MFHYRHPSLSFSGSRSHFFIFNKKEMKRKSSYSVIAESRGLERKSRVAAAAVCKQINRKQTRLHWPQNPTPPHTHIWLKIQIFSFKKRCINECLESNEATGGPLVIVEQNKWSTLCCHAFGETDQRNVWRHKHVMKKSETSYNN